MKIPMLLQAESVKSTVFLQTTYYTIHTKQINAVYICKANFYFFVLAVFQIRNNAAISN